MPVLYNRIALITGAARGIGEGIARRFAREGAKVIVADIDVAEAEDLARAIGAEAQHVDITSAPSVAALADHIQDAHGHLDILVNNAAILDMTSIHALTFDHYRHVMDVNLDGTIRVTMAMLPLIEQTGAARRILNIASIMGVRGQPDAIPYSTAKGGVINFTRALAADLGKQGICVNAIAPGFIDTRMALLPDGSGHEHETEWFREIYLKHGRILLGRSGTADDIAGPACFLCSDDSRYVTGQILLVDGGVSATF
jgi:NAD(P)-dependent dehydrogenase (short-subunit alcohol dehydrogenase family)